MFKTNFNDVETEISLLDPFQLYSKLTNYIELAFVLDLTLNNWLNAFKTEFSKILKYLNITFENIKIRVCIIGFSDFYL